MSARSVFYGSRRGVGNFIEKGRILGLLHSLFLGFIQGLTEFLPVSSSGHLVLFQRFFGLHEPELFFDICLHVGTLGAVCLFFRRDIAGLVKATLAWIACRGQVASMSPAQREDLILVGLILAGSVPTAILGLVIKEFSQMIFASLALVGVMLCLTAGLLAATALIPQGRDQKLTLPKALLIGLIQGVAVLPGLSRSGSTIVLALFLGVSRERAARFSFLLSIPAIVGASLLSLLDISAVSGPGWGVIAAGTAVSAVTGYLALRLLVYIVGQGKLHFFAPYCLIVGLIALAVGW
ncbi:undecaprenyl-diphosphate phosphatase [Desulfoluna sp.]|uniref:undecaprenyl-diphosphate phosphatase n=1 Tax=Desulfoluna sp. TaxID=2045199 RepID=UPI00261CBA6F|nr:undecaprenyl-diphosphate phosphatase [Desulfoluna sp.]